MQTYLVVCVFVLSDSSTNRSILGDSAISWNPGRLLSTYCI